MLHSILDICSEREVGGSVVDSVFLSLEGYDDISNEVPSGDKKRDLLASHGTHHITFHKPSATTLTPTLNRYFF